MVYQQHVHPVQVPAKLARIPGPLVAIVGVTIISVVFPFHVRRIELDGSPLDALQLPGIPGGHHLRT